MFHPAFLTLVVAVALVALVVQSKPHRRAKVALMLWLGSVGFNAYVLGGSGWASLISVALFVALLFAKGIPMILRSIHDGPKATA